MRSIRALLTALSVTVGVAACADTPTAGAAPEAEPAFSSTNTPPVAVITSTGSQLVVQFPNGSSGRRFFLTAADSYDPDGTVTSWWWSSDCINNPTVPGSETYTLEVYTGETCDVSLRVWDNDGASTLTQKVF